VVVHTAPLPSQCQTHSVFLPVSYYHVPRQAKQHR
jgi:hypothetical protein